MIKQIYPELPRSPPKPQALHKSLKGTNKISAAFPWGIGDECGGLHGLSQGRLSKAAFCKGMGSFPYVTTLQNMVSDYGKKLFRAMKITWKGTFV